MEDEYSVSLTTLRIHREIIIKLVYVELMSTSKRGESFIQLSAVSQGIWYQPSLFSIEFAYSHSVTYRIFIDSISSNPYLVLISYVFRKLLGMSCFHYEYG